MSDHSPDRFPQTAIVRLPPPPGAEPVPVSAEGPRDAWTVFTRERQAAFLASLTEAGEVRLACRAAGISPQTAYRARRKSAALARAWDAACLAARPVAEEALACRALDGVEEAVFYRGEEVARRRRYDSRLLLAHLARLDALAERSDAAAALPLLDAAIEGLREGRAIDELLPENAAPEEPQAAPANSSLDPVPSVPSSPAEPCPDCGGNCVTPGARLTQADCQWLGNRLDRMYEARPEDALHPSRLATGLLDPYEIEALQLEAFEAGEDLWWELTGGEDEDEDEGLDACGF